MTTIFFDGDATLWDFQGLLRRVMASTIQRLRERLPDVDGDLSVEAFIADRHRAAAAQTGRRSHEELRQLGFEESLRRLGRPDAALAQDLTEHFFAERFTTVDLYPDSVPCLEDLRARGYRIGLLSNGNTYPDRVGIGHLFDAVLFAHDVGADKPSPLMYEAAAAALPAEHHVMVGDDQRDDVLGAAACGWTGVWINRDDAPAMPERPDTAQIPSLQQLPGLLVTLGRTPV